MKRILVPLDGSHLAERAIEVAAPMAQAVEGSLVLLRVVPPFEEARLYIPDAAEELRGAQVQAAEEYLAAVSARIAADRLSTETHVVIGPVVESIAEQATHLHCEMIALTSHGMGGRVAQVFGSVALKLLHAAPSPVLVIRSTASDLADEEEGEERAADTTLLRELSPSARRRKEDG